MTAEKNLTDQALKALSTDKTQKDFPIGGIPGFVVQVSKNGRKTFMLVYRSPEPAHLPARERKLRRAKLGVYPVTSLADARSKAKAYQGDLARGKDPQGSPKRRKKVQHEEKKAASFPADVADRLRFILGSDTEPEEGTFSHLASEYLQRHAWTNKKRTRDDESMLRRDLIPAWGNRRAVDVRKRDVIDMLDRIMDRGAPVAARNTKALISKIFSFGIARDMVEHNPTAGVEPPPKAREKKTWLKDEEIKALWAELDNRSIISASIFRTILLTLQRPGEVCQMEWSEINGDWWELPGEKTKNGRPHRVYLSTQVRAILENLRPITGGSRYVFQSTKKDGQPMTCLNKTCYAICKATGLDFTPHDLRRTGSTHLAVMGQSDEVIDAVLNHAKQGVVKIYNRYGYETEKKKVLTEWGEKVAGLIREPLKQAA